MTFILDSKGWIKEALHCVSPHFNERPSNMPISCLVIHNISLPPGEFGGNYVEKFFCDQLDFEAHPSFESLKNLKVSSHFFIKRDSTLIQFVSCFKRAWHAGVSSFQGKDNVNDFSIGIELEGTDTLPYEVEQYETLIKLTNTLLQYFPHIQKTHIVGHCHIAPGRKTDPGPAFDWLAYLQTLD